MSASPEPSAVNGHASPLEDSPTINIANGDHSDSDLSDVQPAYPDVPSPQSAEESDTPDRKPDITFEEPSDSSDNAEDEDADFDVDDSPVSQHSAGGDADPDLLSESRSASKRKAGVVNEDDFMRENPELYGLRRSVCYPHILD